MALTDYDAYQGLYPIEAIDQAITDIDTVKTYIPSGASAQNKLATASDVSSVDAKADAKQNELSSEQLAAVNSGIDSTKVEAIESNTNAIAEISESISGQETEIEDARSGYDGTSYLSVGDAVRSQIEDINSDLIDFNSFDFLDTIADRTDVTRYGITYEWHGRTCHVSGTSTSNSFQTIYYGNVPSFISVGEPFDISYSTTDSNIFYEVYYEPDGGGLTLIITSRENAKITIPNTASKILIRLYVPSGKIVNGDACVAILSNASVMDLAKESLCSRTYILDSTDLNNVVENSVYLLTDGKTYSHMPPNITGGFLICFKSFETFAIQLFLGIGQNVLYKRIRNQNSTWSAWVSVNHNIYQSVGTSTDGVMSQKFLTEGNNGFSKDVSSYVSSNNLALSDVKEPGYYILSTTYNITDKPQGFTPMVLKVERTHYDSPNRFIRQSIWTLSGSDVGKVYFRNSNVSGVFGDWILQEGGSGVTYNITQNINRDEYTNIYNITTNPEITTDANGWLQAVDTNTESETNKTDMSGAILSMLNSTGYCHLSEGIFYVSGFEMPEGTVLEGCGKKTIVRLLSSIDSGFCTRINRYNTVKNICFSGGYSSPSDLYTEDTDLGSRHGVYVAANADGEESAHAAATTNIVTNCWFENFDGSAFYAHNTGGGVDGVVMMSDCRMIYCKVGINVDYYSEYCKFTNVIISHTNVACINNGGNNVFSSCTFHGVVGFVIDNSANDKRNNAHGTCIGCTFNHINNMNQPSTLGMGDAVVIKEISNGFIFTGCQFWYGEINIENGRGISFSDCLIGGNTPTITIAGVYSTFFMGCIFHATPTLSVPSNTRFINCYNDLTGAEISN